MRQDMSKVVTECYRTHSKRQNPDTRNNRRNRNRGSQMEEAPFRDRMRPHHQVFTERREFGEHLTPLYRFLNSKVGQHWDIIYSEVCQHLNRNSTTHRHIFQHLWDAVVRYVEVQDGQLGKTRPWGFSPFQVETLYIDPTTSILKRWRPPPKKKVCSSLYVRKKGRFFYKNGGTWMELKFLPIPDFIEVAPGVWEGGRAKDLIRGTVQRDFRRLRHFWYRTFRLTDKYCAEVLSLTPTQMKHLGLKND